MKRLKMLDYARGFAILCMMFFHSFQFYEGDLNELAASQESNPIASIIKFFGRWAGIFVIISGFAFAYVNTHRLTKKGLKPRSMIKETAVFAAILITIETIFSLFFHRTSRGGGVYNYQEGPYHYSIVIGYRDHAAKVWLFCSDRNRVKYIFLKLFIRLNL